MGVASLHYQFRSRSIVAYYKRSPKNKDSFISEKRHSFISEKRQQAIDNFKFKKQKPYSGMVTDGSQKRLTKAIENLLQVARPKFMYHEGREYCFKVNFVTLTLYSFSRKVPGQEAHKLCLEPLLRWLRSKGMSAYVWKAELQSKRKDCHQLHYHLTTDIFIDCFELRNKWNELQRKAGYLDSFFKKYHHWDANSTDVHATHNKKNLVGYLKKKIVRYSDKKKYQNLRSKYLIAAEMAKADQNKETIEGKVWDCSLNLKVAFYEIDSFFDITKRIVEGVKKDELNKKEFERCTVYELTNRNKDACDYLPILERHFYYEHIEKMRNFERLKPDINVFSSS